MNEFNPLTQLNRNLVRKEFEPMREYCCCIVDDDDTNFKKEKKFSNYRIDFFAC